jgi:hypothetical protein
VEYNIILAQNIYYLQLWLAKIKHFTDRLQEQSNQLGLPVLYIKIKYMAELEKLNYI